MRIYNGISLIILAFMVLFAAIVLPGSARAQEAASQIKSISPPASFDAGETAGEIHSMEMHYFNLRGYIDAIDSNRIVVGDRQRLIAPGTDVSGFEKGMYVGAHVDDANRVTAIRQLAPPKPTKSTP